jgi:hypothetical protein
MVTFTSAASNPPAGDPSCGTWSCDRFDPLFPDRWRIPHQPPERQVSTGMVGSGSAATEHLFRIGSIIDRWHRSRRSNAGCALSVGAAVDAAERADGGDHRSGPGGLSLLRYRRRCAQCGTGPRPVGVDVGLVVAVAGHVRPAVGAAFSVMLIRRRAADLVRPATADRAAADDEPQSRARRPKRAPGLGSAWAARPAARRARLERAAPAHPPRDPPKLSASVPSPPVGVTPHVDGLLAYDIRFRPVGCDGPRSPIVPDI